MMWKLWINVKYLYDGFCKVSVDVTVTVTVIVNVIFTVHNSWLMSKIL